MSRSLYAPLYTVIDDVAMGANINGKATDVSRRDEIFYDVEWSAGAVPIGAMTFEWSDTNDVNSIWKPLDFGQPISITGNTGNHQVLISKVNFKYVRPVYTRTSGDGTLKVGIRSSAKGV